MSPAVCLGGSLRTAFELGAAWAVSMAAYIKIAVTQHCIGEHAKRHHARRMLGLNKCKKGMCEKVIAKLSRLG